MKLGKTRHKSLSAPELCLKNYNITKPYTASMAYPLRALTNPWPLLALNQRQDNKRLDDKTKTAAEKHESMSIGARQPKIWTVWTD